MKPNDINAILSGKEINGIPYLSLIEAGERLDSKVLSWVIQFTIKNKINFYWQIDGGVNYIGVPEFINAMQNQD